MDQQPLYDIRQLLQQKIFGDFPKHVANRVQYGPNVESLVGYLHARQYLPDARTKQFLTDVMGLPIRSRLNRTRLQGLKFSTHGLLVFAIFKKLIPSLFRKD